MLQRYDDILEFYPAGDREFRLNSALWPPNLHIFTNFFALGTCFDLYEMKNKNSQTNKPKQLLAKIVQQGTSILKNNE